MNSVISPKKNVELADIIHKAVNAQQQGFLIENPSHINIDEKYNVQHLLKLTKGLCLPEITILLESTNLREYGLSSIKAGDLENGSLQIDAAAQKYNDKTLSREAIIVADSFQMAAEAYLQYKQNDFSKALNSLVNAIKACNNLRDEYNYDVEIRRIHLARNIVRVMAFNDDQIGACLVAFKLLGYIQGATELWPFPNLTLTTQSDHLIKEEQWFLIDQILAELSFLISIRNAKSSNLINMYYDILSNDMRCLYSEFEQVYLWLDAQHASVKGDHLDFLNRLITFYSGGSYHLPRAWKEITLDFNSLFKLMYS